MIEALEEEFVVVLSEFVSDDAALADVMVPGRVGGKKSWPKATPVQLMDAVSSSRLHSGIACSATQRCPEGSFRSLRMRTSEAMRAWQRSGSAVAGCGARAVAPRGKAPARALRPSPFGCARRGLVAQEARCGRLAICAGGPLGYALARHGAGAVAVHGCCCGAGLVGRASCYAGWDRLQQCGPGMVGTNTAGTTEDSHEINMCADIGRGHLSPSALSVFLYSSLHQCDCDAAALALAPSFGVAKLRGRPHLMLLGMVKGSC